MSQISSRRRVRRQAREGSAEVSLEEEVLLEEIELVVPWKALLNLIDPHCPMAGHGCRPYSFNRCGCT